MDRSAGVGATDRRAAGSLDPPRSHPGDERGQLSAEEQQEDERSESSIEAREPRQHAGEQADPDRATGCFWRRLPRRPKRAALRASQGAAPAAPKSRKPRAKERIEVRERPPVTTQPLQPRRDYRHRQTRPASPQWSPFAPPWWSTFTPPLTGNIGTIQIEW